MAIKYNYFSVKLRFTDTCISNAILTKDEINQVKDLCGYLDMSMRKYLTMLIKRDLKNREKS